MKYLYLAACLFCYAFQADAQFTNTDVRTEQLGLRTGAAYWWSNFKSNSPGLGVDEELYYRREHKHWSLELSLNYSTYKRPLAYYDTYTDMNGASYTAYDKEMLSTYAFILSVQYRITDGNRFKSYIGAYANPVYYYFNIGVIPVRFDTYMSGGDIKMGGGISYTTEYSLSRHFGLNASIRCGYLKQRDASFNPFYVAPEFKTSLIIGCGYFF